MGSVMISATVADLFVLHYLVEVAAGITVAVLTGAVAYYQGTKKAQKRVSKAQFVFVNRLDELIRKALQEGPKEAVLNARAIVTVRNSLADSLVSISSQLNSEIDRLAKEIGSVDTYAIKRTEYFVEPNADATYATIQVLAKIWPAKRSQIVIGVRKLLAELGLPFDPAEETPFEYPSGDRAT
jgi:hypothetical protein